MRLLAVASRLLSTKSELLLQKSANICTKTTRSAVTRTSHRKMSTYEDGDRKFQNNLTKLIKHLPPSLTKGGNYKGQAGKIGIVGGSFEYTGAPYFAAISALRVGADLVHIFCQKDAAVPIKTYSPELIVHPLIEPADWSKKSAEAKQWIQKMSTVVIGPGLGRDSGVLEIVKDLICFIKEKRIDLIIDADALFLITYSPDLLVGFNSTVILTPNKVELQRLIGAPNPLRHGDPLNGFFDDKGEHVVVLAKGEEDVVTTKDRVLALKGLRGSNRRCGGQGDILAGSLAVFLNWSKGLQENRAFVACLAASKLVRECNSAAFAKRGRSMIATDMIEEIHEVFENHFEY